MILLGCYVTISTVFSITILNGTFKIAKLVCFPTSNTKPQPTLMPRGQEPTLFLNSQGYSARVYASAKLGISEYRKLSHPDTDPRTRYLVHWPWSSEYDLLPRCIPHLQLTIERL